MGFGVELDQANALLGAGRVPEAIALLSRVIAKRPREARALHMLGVAHAQRGAPVEAEQLLERARSAAPRDALILTDLATLLVMTGRSANALPLLERALKQQPALRQAMFYRGVVLKNLGRAEEALEVFDSLAAAEPNNPLYQHNRASLLADVGRYDEAEGVANSVLARDPSYLPAQLVRGLAATNRGELARAIEIFDRILERDPNYLEARYNRGFLRLLAGDLPSGWLDYECRWDRAGYSMIVPSLDIPRWSGEALDGRTILVYAEQGLGDTFMCCRYLPRLVERGATVLFLGAGNLSTLLRTMCADVRYVDAVPANQHVDFQIALMSLPLRFNTTLSNLPADVPYLSADPTRAADWRNRLGPSGFKVGINWQGNPNAKVDFGRSIPLREFYPISQIPGVRLISLQKHAGLEQLASLPPGMIVETLESSATDGFLDTAAVMSNMDLIVSSDTSVANLAGAMGLRAWIVLKRLPDWRWLLDSSSSPWFPTLRLFRQTTSGVWHDAFETIAREIAGLPQLIEKRAG